MSSSERLLVYPRMLIKLSGEALAGETGFGVDNDLLDVDAFKNWRQEYSVVEALKESFDYYKKLMLKK